ncbi:MAG TPA: SDR family oxidoreductase [Opitutaceae bacterium]|nr:SDR family oxidoreductase [Opitutaceae bacterium]
MSTSFLDNLFGLKDRVAIVIGGTGELCGAMAEGLAQAGAEVVLVGRSLEKAQARIAKIEQAGGRAWFHAADASDRVSIEKLRDAVLERSKRIDIVVNGAGVNSATPFFQIEDAELDRILNINFRGIFLSCQVFGKYLVEQGKGGSIINLGSMSGIIPLSRVFTYSASKAAVHNLTKNLAREWAPQNIRVNVIAPGFFPAEQNRKVLTPERVNMIMGHTPMKRFGDAQELIGATLLLASEKAGGFITGTELAVDGGFSSMTI